MSESSESMSLILTETLTGHITSNFVHILLPVTLPNASHCGNFSDQFITNLLQVVLVTEH